MIKVVNFNILYFIFISVLFISPKGLIAQNNNIISKKITEVTVINNEFQIILDSLIREEKKCITYKNELFWSVFFYEHKDGTYTINITLKRELSETYKYLGCFKISDVYIIVTGKNLHPDFFKKEKNEQLFKIKKNKIPKPEDYNSWLYFYKNKSLSLRKEYTLPCK
ncbi:MAG: hypothetical protein IPK18_11720 [Sphingobacteriales bacterium]|jgi:hypothetical protein|nr:MAG: hypothetical protein IPK18_11720 [Sphingobacteriales bacterium]